MLALLAGQGFQVIGPRRIDEAIVYAPLDTFDDLPIGVTDRQMPGRYSLHDSDRRSYFDAAVGAHSLKSLLHPSSSTVWDITRNDDGALSIEMHRPDTAPLAVIGVRPCELAALEKQDRVLMGGPHINPVYAANRRGLFIVAVNCNHPSGTCFCTAMGNGPDRRERLRHPPHRIVPEKRARSSSPPRARTPAHACSSPSTPTRQRPNSSSVPTNWRRRRGTR